MVDFAHSGESGSARKSHPVTSPIQEEEGEEEEVNIDSLLKEIGDEDELQVDSSSGTVTTTATVHTDSKSDRDSD